jgi:hypothetical protein
MNLLATQWKAAVAVAASAVFCFWLGFHGAGHHAAAPAAPVKASVPPPAAPEPPPAPQTPRPSPFAVRQRRVPPAAPRANRAAAEAPSAATDSAAILSELEEIYARALQK